jgi:phage-related protein
MTDHVEDASPKPLVWIGSSKRDLMALPGPVADTFGYALFLAQIGRRHESTRILRGFGDASVIEIKESYGRNAYRAVYTVRFHTAVFVLHVFRKKSKSSVATPKRDMALINARLNYAARLAREM